MYLKLAEKQVLISSFKTLNPPQVYMYDRSGQYCPFTVEHLLKCDFCRQRTRKCSFFMFHVLVLVQGHSDLLYPCIVVNIHYVLYCAGQTKLI